ncbi:MAG: nucleoid occlusion protein, partial [Oscillospiraceae bacterium]|nr:nucleoid occlusion protein [Oscillospiraceae bacterium]
RHGRALLRLPDGESQRAALEYIRVNGLTVAAAEEYIEELLRAPEEAEEKAEPKRMLVLKDVRIFLNSLNRSLELMKQGGISAGLKRQETEDSLILTISIPKNRK